MPWLMLVMAKVLSSGLFAYIRNQFYCIWLCSALLIMYMFIKYIIITCLVIKYLGDFISSELWIVWCLPILTVRGHFCFKLIKNHGWLFYRYTTHSADKNCLNRSTIQDPIDKNMGCCQRQFYQFLCFNPFFGRGIHSALKIWYIVHFTFKVLSFTQLKQQYVHMVKIISKLGEFLKGKWKDL